MSTRLTRRNHDATIGALATFERTCSEPLRRSQSRRLAQLVERLVDELETYGSAFALGSSPEDEATAARMWTVTNWRLRELAFDFEAVTVKRPALAPAIVALTNMLHVDAFLVGGPLWIDRLRRVLVRLQEHLARIMSVLCSAAPPSVSAATLRHEGVATFERAPPRACPRTPRRSRVALGLRSRTDGGGPDGPPDSVRARAA